MQYKEILENISDWLWAVDTSGKYTYCSQNVFDFLGYTAEEVIGKTPFDFMSEEESSRVSNLFGDLVFHRDPIIELENTNIHKDGSIVILKTSGVPVYDEDGIWLGYEGTDTNITEKKNLEQTKVNYELLHKLTENVPGAIFQYRLYPDGKSSYLYLSKGIENIYEVSQEDVLQDASLIFKKIHPDDLNMVEVSIKESVETMKEFNLEYRVNLRKKGLRWLHEKAKVEKLEDGSILWHGVINDITEQVVSKQKLLFQAELLQQKKQELETIIQDAPNPMMLHNEDGIVLMINQAWIDFSGYSQEEIPSINAWVNCVYDDIEIRAKTKAHIYSLYNISKKNNEGEFTFFNKIREEITWKMSSAPLGIIDGKRTIISSAMDITERKIFEEKEKIDKKELVSLYETLQAQVEKNQLLLKENKLFIADMVHQIRTPLSVIMINSSLIEMETKNQVSFYVAQINSAINMLSNSYEDLNYLISSDTIEYKAIEINLTEFIHERIDFFEVISEANDKTIYTNIADDVKVTMNDTELERLIDNNLSNAIKHSYDKSEIEIVLEKNHSEIILKFISKGRGIKDIAKIFDKNYTESYQAKRNLGLGLHMVKNICDKNYINYSIHSKDETNIFTYVFNG